MKINFRQILLLILFYFDLNKLSIYIALNRKKGRIAHDAAIIVYHIVRLLIFDRSSKVNETEAAESSCLHKNQNLLKIKMKKNVW